MSFRGAFGATPQRQSSGSLGGAALPSPSAYTRSNGSFPFQGAGLASPTPLSPNAPNGHASAASALLEPNLDPSDFPALSGGSLAPSQQSSLVSSYASQAGTALPPGALHPSTILGGSLSPAGTLPTVASALMGLPPRDFSSDDFPALGGFAAAHHDIGMGLPSNLASTNGSPAPPRSTSSEQASAAAALQHQQAALQHRANLLGSMNGNPVRYIPFHDDEDSNSTLELIATLRQTFGLKQAPTNPQWTSSPTLANPTLSTQLDTLHLSNGGIGPTMDQQPSPSLLSTTTTTTGPPGVARAIGGTTSAAPTSPLPPNATISNPPPTGTIPQTPAQQVLFSPADRYGLLGLLHIIKTSDPDLSMLALGSDLTSLGLDLGATECVSFVSLVSLVVATTTMTTTTERFR